MGTPGSQNGSRYFFFHGFDFLSLGDPFIDLFDGKGCLVRVVLVKWKTIVHAVFVEQFIQAFLCRSIVNSDEAEVSKHLDERQKLERMLRQNVELQGTRGSTNVVGGYLGRCATPNPRDRLHDTGARFVFLVRTVDPPQNSHVAPDSAVLRVDFPQGRQEIKPALSLSVSLSFEKKRK